MTPQRFLFLTFKILQLQALLLSRPRNSDFSPLIKEGLDGSRGFYLLYHSSPCMP